MRMLMGKSMKIRNLSSRIAPWIWSYRFWTYLGERTGRSTEDLQNDFLAEEIEALIREFDGDPEGAADAQLVKWREARPHDDLTLAGLVLA